MKLINAILLSVLFLPACRKDLNPNNNSQKQLPPLTQTGAGTFGCKVNGDIWLPYVAPSLFGSPHELSSYRRKNGFEVDASINLGNATADYIHLYVKTPIAINQVVKVKRYSTIDTISFAIYSKTENNINQFNSDSIENGYVIFSTFDTTKNIYSGIFSFDAIDTQRGKTMKITDGRFDVNGKGY